MAINFPASPSVNDTFTVGSITYKCVQNNPTKWIGLGLTPADRLVEGSNSLEINANNDLVWSGDSVLLGTSTANASDKLTIHDPGTAFMSIRSDVASDTNSQVLDFGVGTAERSSSNLTAVIAADIHSTSGGTLKSDLVFSTNAGDNISDKFRITSDGQLQATSAADVRLTLGSSGTAGTNNSVHVRADSADLKFMAASSGSTIFEVNGTETLRIDSGGRIAQGGRTPTNHGSPQLLLWGSDTTLHITSSESVNNSSNTGIKFAVAGGSTGDYSKAGIFAKRMASYNDLDLLFCFNSANDATGVSTAGEKMRIRNNGDLILGPYDAPGTFTNAANNVPYSIKVAPYGWSNGSEICGISMGNHSGATGNDEGEIVFKTAQNVHTDATGLKERARINHNGSFTVSTYGGLVANGSPANFALWQASAGKITMASSGTYQRFMHCGHTCAATLYLYVTSGDAVNGGGHMLEYRIQIIYGSPTIDLVDSRSFGSSAGNISSVNVQYNNSGYQLEVQVVWTSGTTLPRTNWAIQGMSSSSWNP